MAIDEFDDILGPAPAKRGRPTKEEAARRQQERDAGSRPWRDGDMDDINDGVSIPWIIEHFKMSRPTILDRLKDCPVHRRHPTRGNPYYLLPVAAQYLVDPATNRNAFKDLKAADLPERLREPFWNAKIKEMKFRVLAGELWPTENVMEVLSDTYTLISGTTKLWVGDLEEESRISDEQRQFFNGRVDALLVAIRETLIERAENKVSASYAAEMD